MSDDWNQRRALAEVLRYPSRGGEHLPGWKESPAAALVAGAVENHHVYSGRGAAMRERIDTVITEARGMLERAYGDRLAGVVLFGSHARGDAEPGSDVDLLVVLRGDVSATTEVSRLSGGLAELSLHHDVVVSCAFVSEERYRNEQSPFLLNVRREGIAA